MLQRIICCKYKVPQFIMWMYFLVPLTYFCGHLLDINKIILSYHLDREFGAIFRLVSFLQRVLTLGDSSLGRDRYPYLALYFFEAIASAGPHGWIRYWLLEASRLL
jgi:hypothetical protein